MIGTTLVQVYVNIVLGCFTSNENCNLSDYDSIRTETYWRFFL